jgi:hypothetical protein
MLGRANFIEQNCKWLVPLSEKRTFIAILLCLNLAGLVVAIFAVWTTREPKPRTPQITYKTQSNLLARDGNYYVTDVQFFPDRTISQAEGELVCDKPFSGANAFIFASSARALASKNGDDKVTRVQFSTSTWTPTNPLYFKVYSDDPSLSRCWAENLIPH